ncbi:MAG TPA: hypothetical protein VG015_02600 [Candidatus Dormibacteraeota bacterium]|jgi:hypothetical protein|nr:hypothetical protein [Candidatus Dormibacteraeota bacterium]
MAVFDQHRPLGEAEERLAGHPKLGCTDEHSTINEMAPPGVGVDRRATIDEGVELAQGAFQRKPLRSDLHDQEGAVSCGLDIQGHKFGFVERSERSHFRCGHPQGCPEHRPNGVSRL